MRYTTIIWDLDGTLMDTLIDLQNSVNHALALNAMPERSYQEIRTFVGNGVRKLVERAVPEGTEPEVLDKVFADFKEHYAVHCQDNTCLYAGVADAIRALKRAGICMAVVSNKLQSGVTELYESQIRMAGSADTFCMKDCIEVAIGERAGMARKPAPDMVDLAFSELGCSKENAVYIGDSEVDLATAANSGLPCISVLWGFRDRELLIEKGATTFAETPQQLLPLIVGEFS